MFNIGPLELMVLAVVGLIVLGPDRLPGFIRDAGRLIKSLRDMATGARQQLRDELGPEFADIDLRNLNPRTAITKAVFGDDPPPDLTKYDPRRFDARSSARGFLYGDDKPATDAPSAETSNGRVSMSKPASNGTTASSNGASSNGAPSNGTSANGASANGAARPRPRPRPAQPPAGFDDIA